MIGRRLRRRVGKNSTVKKADTAKLYSYNTDILSRYKLDEKNISEGVLYKIAKNYIYDTDNNIGYRVVWDKTGKITGYMPVFKIDVSEGFENIEVYWGVPSGITTRALDLMNKLEVKG